jgi:IS30 family transposase
VGGWQSWGCRRRNEISGSARRPWTPEDQEKLDALLDAGREAAEIAVTLNRTRQAVYARLQRLYRKQTRLPALSRSGLRGNEKGSANQVPCGGNAAEEWSMHQDIEGDLNSRPWTHADDDKLRRLALTGLSVRAIGIRLSRTEAAVCSRARRLQVILRKIKRKQLQMG